jgi:hypothetical protein
MRRRRSRRSRMRKSRTRSQRRWRSVVRSWALSVVVVCVNDGRRKICGDESARSDEESLSESYARPRSGVGRIGGTF